MPDTNNKTDQEKGDEVLRRLLKTPPDPKKGSDEATKPRKNETDRGQAPSSS